MRLRIALIGLLGLVAVCSSVPTTVHAGTTERLVVDRTTGLAIDGFDPVAYFTLGKPMRGYPQLAETHEGRTYYFLNDKYRAMFRASPAKYEPQYGGFCSNGAPYALKLGSDPTEFEIVDGRLFVFGDILGRVVHRPRQLAQLAADRPVERFGLAALRQRQVAAVEQVLHRHDAWATIRPGDSLFDIPQARRGGVLYNCLVVRVACE